MGELFAATGAPLIVTDTVTAETIKYASNAFLATKLGFVNSLANLCESVGADVRDVILGLGYDHRIGFDFLRPGPGWGGSCLPKDTSALIHIADDAGYDFAMLRAAIAGNEEQRERVVAKVADAAGGSLAGRRGGGLGPHLQGRDRRPPQLPGRGRRPPAGRAGGLGTRLRPHGGPVEGPAPTTCRV